MIIPTIFNADVEMVLCKSWIKKKWKKTKKFVKKHKKAIIIGAAIVVAAAVVVVAVAAASSATAAAAASAAGAAGSASSSKSDASNKQEQKEDAPPVNNVPSEITTHEDPALKTAMKEEITFFKENVAKESFFQPLDPLKQHQDLSWEEHGRILGSLLGRDLAQNIPEHLKLPQDRQKTYVFPDPKEPSTISEMPRSFAALEIDNKFSTNHASFYRTGNKEIDFSAISHQLLGEKALDSGLWRSAVDCFGITIACTPANPLPYLERGVAHFSLGQYDHCLKDYHTYTQMQTATLSVPEFGLGFAKGLPKGVYDSGKGIFLLVSDLITSPIHTGKQIWDALVLLSDLARSEEWSKLSKILAPEVHQLVKEWDTLPSDVKVTV